MSISRPPPWPAPAKLNLFLHILRRRPDGYHELQTCFQFVDLCDEITIEVRADGTLGVFAEEVDFNVSFGVVTGDRLEIAVSLLLLRPPIRIRGGIRAGGRS